jgi:CBS domain containing-hemolysin-like protein
LIFAAWPLSALVIATTSALVAARNFQAAWLMRTLGEEQYREWYVQRLRETPLPLYLFCLLGQTLLVAAVGAALMLFSGGRLPAFAIGLGIVAYAIAVVFYTSLALWRIRRSGG